jgi:hypothetical protein
VCVEVLITAIVSNCRSIFLIIGCCSLLYRYDTLLACSLKKKWLEFEILIYATTIQYINPTECIKEIINKSNPAKRREKSKGTWRDCREYRAMLIHLAICLECRR